MVPETGTLSEFKKALFDNVFTYVCGACQRVYPHALTQTNLKTRCFCERCMERIEKQVMNSRAIFAPLELETDGPSIPMDYVYGP